MIGFYLVWRALMVRGLTLGNPEVDVRKFAEFSHLQIMKAQWWKMQKNVQNNECSRIVFDCSPAGDLPQVWTRRSPSSEREETTTASRSLHRRKSHLQFWKKNFDGLTWKSQNIIYKFNNFKVPVNGDEEEKDIFLRCTIEMETLCSNLFTWKTLATRADFCFFGQESESSST